MMRLNSIHYFRGIAIAIIVAGHCMNLVGWTSGGFITILIANLIMGGSILFVFISGFLFYHVYLKAFSYKPYLIKKTKFIFLPYLIFSLSIISCCLVFGTWDNMVNIFTTAAAHNAILGHIWFITLSLLTGAAITGYWYIPFIMIIFLVSPVLIDFMKLKITPKIVIICILLLVACLIHRPVYNLLVPQSVMYYLPVYLLGMVASENKELIYLKFQGREFYLLLAAMILALFQVIFYKNYAGFVKSPFEITVFDIYLIQKTILCFFFMIWLHRFEDIDIPILGTLADASFAIYFIHPIVLMVSVPILLRYNITVVIMVFFSVMALSYGFAYLLRGLFNSNSRYIIGW